ncbi:MAG: hypothetical protein BGO67_10360 [Alphaproteobacteria bacterium 41-28]|nr:MAG: hypothetical protein BGO67_10360 [Alphaproteobacteria bacterium 41-28]
MLKKLISYLVIFSILFVDSASCMQEAEEHEHLLPGRRLSLDHPQPHNPPDAPEARETDASYPQGDNAETRNSPAPQPFVRPLPLPEKEGDSLPSQGSPEPVVPLPSEGDGEKVRPQRSLLIVEEKEEIRPFVSLSSVEEDEEKVEAPSFTEEGENSFVVLPDHGSQLKLHPVEGAPLLEDSLIQETPSQKYLRLLRINPQDLTPEEIEDLQTILRIEGSWKNYVVWANLEALLHKSVFALTTNKHAINKRKQKTCCAPLWLHGGPIPLDSSSAINRNVILKSFGSSLEEGVIESIHTILLALMGYQVYKLIQSGEWTTDFGSLVSFYFIDADIVSYLGMIRTLHESPELFALLGVPLVYAVAKTLYNYWQISEPTDKAVGEDIEGLTNRSPKWDSVIFNILSVIPFVSSLLNFHPLKRKIPAITTLILWEGRLPPEARENAFTALSQLAHTRKGLSQMTAIESLYHLSQGMHLKNLIQRPHDVEDLLHIKLRAFHALKEIYQDLPTISLNKFRTAVLLWEMGQSPSWFISIIEPANKVIRAVFYWYVLYGLIDVLYKYITCPFEYLEKFSWVGGLEPYASDYSKECFDAQVKAFNTLPGQPAYTLVGDLGRYHFPGPYDLDLSNKGIQGPVIADIVEGFKKANVPLKSLDVSHNAITNSSDIARIFEALPLEIINLSMEFINRDNGYSSSHHFLELGRLTGLQSFDISNTALSPDNIGAIGQALQNLPYLKELRLGWDSYYGELNTNIAQIAQSFKPSLIILDLGGFDLSSDLEGQIALGNSLAQIPTLKELYLGFTGIGGNDQTNTTLNEAATIALAHGISAQQNLCILDLSNNFIGKKDASFLLSSLPPSLTDLDVSDNEIYYQGDVKALAQAVQQMSELTSFKIDDNQLRNSPDLLKALQKKQKLTILELSQNFFNDTIQLRDLLQTTPNLETLKFSNNQLTKGSILVPALSTLGKLKSLDLGGNNFTTADRVSLWQATSYLTKIPFYLDEDLNFASTYLKSFNSTTTRLDLPRLIPNDPSALGTIMPQVVDLFPNLRELDLSYNFIFGVGYNNTPIIGGIQALITYLPHLTTLQSLRMSFATDNLYHITPPEELITFPQIIGQLPNLQNIDFSDTPFLFANSLGKGLENIHSLTSINLTFCWYNFFEAPDTWQGGIQLIQGLQAQPHLIHLKLSGNQIGSSSGSKDPNSTLALAKGLNSWPHLQSLGLGNCRIGYEDPSSASLFLEKLADLAGTVNKQGRTLEVELFNGIENVAWTQGAGVLQTLTQQKIENACARELCTGDPISKPAPSETHARGFQRERNTLESSLLVATSDAVSSHQVPWYSPAKWIMAWKSFWQGSPQAIDMTNLQVEELVRFKERCDRLIAKANTRSADRWYRFSLEDLREDVEEIVKNPRLINKDTLKHFFRRLDGIDRDFLGKPLLKKPSFFATSTPIEMPLTELKTMTELCSVSMPLVGSGPAPLALGVNTY